jgi:hypothetical protein
MYSHSIILISLHVRHVLFSCTSLTLFASNPDIDRMWEIFVMRHPNTLYTIDYCKTLYFVEILIVSFDPITSFVRPQCGVPALLEVC